MAPGDGYKDAVIAKREKGFIITLVLQ